MALQTIFLFTIELIEHDQSLPPSLLSLLAIPDLWVPIFAADILDTLLKEVRPLITHALIQSVLQSHSVLSSVPDPLQASQQSTWKAAFLSAPIVWGSHFVGIVLYASAMTMTATLVLMNPPAIRGLYKQSPDCSFKDTLLFSLKVFAIIFLIGVPWTAIVGLVSIRFPRSQFIWGGGFGILFSIAFTTVVAHLITPTAIRLLRKPRTDPVNVDLIRPARSFAVLTVIASGLLDRLTVATESTFLSRPTPRIGVILFEAVASLVGALPYILLFIALTLVAHPTETEQHLVSSRSIDQTE
jgi:hypothetical protein